MAIIVMMTVRLRTLPAAKPDGTLDVIGAVGLAIALISLLLAVSKGADWGWGSPLTLGLLALTAVSLPGWALWVLRHPSPMWVCGLPPVAQSC